VAAGAGIFSVAEFLIKDLLCLTESTARLRQVIKNSADKMAVVRVRKAFVLVPSIDSTSEKLSVKPPPLPLCISMSTINKAHTTTCIAIINDIIS
jgi:hypothetical protein